MKILRREFLNLAVGAAALSSQRAHADSYPSRPVRVIVGLPPGNSPDIVARLVCAYLSEHLSRPFVVENRPGAATGLATEYVVHTAADGYTLLLVLAGNAVNGWVYKLRYDFIRDVAPVASIGGIPLAMVINPSLPAKTVPEFIAYAKANPGKLFFGSSGNGSLPHILGVLFEMKAGVKLVHVPYKESVFPDLLGGQVQLAFEPVPAVIGYIRSGKLRALGVSTKQRLESVREHQAGLQSFRSMRRIDARRKNDSALRLRFSQSFASRRQRLSHAMVRSTTQRRGRMTKPLA